jgi:hypothetical protein
MDPATSEAAVTQEVIGTYRAFAAKVNERPEFSAPVDLTGARAVVTVGHRGGSRGGRHDPVPMLPATCAEPHETWPAE